MSVHKNSRGLGLGALLVALVEAHARAIGARTVVLSTGSWMDLAMRLYESCGYRVVRTMDFDFLPEREKQPEEVQQREGATFYEKPVADTDGGAKL